MKRKATSWRLVGESYRNGWRNPGFGQVVCDDGSTVYVPESEAIGIAGVLSYAEKQGVDVPEQRARVDEWCKTGGDLVRFSFA